MPILLGRVSSSNNGGTSPRVRKSSSFMSLRKDPPTTYFDVYPKPSDNADTTVDRSSKSKAREVQRQKSNSNQSPSKQGQNSSPNYSFPSFETTDSFFADGEATPRAFPRSRSYTGPSSKSISVQPLRYPSPYDNTPQLNSFGFEESVTVANMDALVDGMNGDTPVSRLSRSVKQHKHPLYQPPLPTPPPGVVLGGGKRRATKQKAPPRQSNSGDEDESTSSTPASRPPRRKPRSARTQSASTIVAAKTQSSSSSVPARTYSVSNIAVPPVSTPKTAPLSIAEIIRNHAPPEAQVRSRPLMKRSSSLYAQSQGGHGMVLEESEPATADEEAEFVSRSSIDSIADEVRRTLRNQNTLKATPPPPVSSPRSHYTNNRHSYLSDNGSSVNSPRSVASSLYSSSAASSQLPASPTDSTGFYALTRPSPSQAVAQYLRSARLTTLLRLTRSPHASQDNPLTVSLSDLGNPSGFPVIVFLGLGCVRHIMGLYDEMAELMGLRLITIDRWGLGRTEPRSKAAKGIMEWASVVEEVLDLLQIEQCSIMAHSAGAPYALSFANKLPGRIRGDLCLLAPWVGGSEVAGSYKWLKYVPNGILKTAQAAEWRIQAWMIGKPPTIAYEGIGYNARTPTQSNRASSPSPASSETGPRPSLGSNFSEYDDLQDFDGRFESHSTLGANAHPTEYHHGGSDSKIFITKRKSSRGFLDRLKGTNSTTPPPPPPPTEEKTPSSGGRRLKALRSMGSLRGKSASQSLSSNRKAHSTSPPTPTPPSLQLQIGLGLEDLNWKFDTPERVSPSSYTPPGSRAGGNRSLSLNSSLTLPNSDTASPTPSALNSPFITPGPSGYEAALGNALIAASHAESAKGTHNDLLQILNHENYSWGFSYSAYPHSVQVWYGDRDEKIAENAVRWMESNMGQGRCHVKVIKGADHSLMYKSSVVIEALERLREFW